MIFLPLRSPCKNNFYQYQLSVLVTPSVYPHLVDFTGRLNFRFKSRPTALVLAAFPNQNLWQMGNEFLSYDRKNKQTSRQTNREYNFKYINLKILHLNRSSTYLRKRWLSKLLFPGSLQADAVIIFLPLLNTKLLLLVGGDL